jgi:hypothetical protein
MASPPPQRLGLAFRAAANAMHPLRLLIMVLVCSLSLVGRSTSSPGTRTAYLDTVSGTSSSGADRPAGWQDRIAGVQLGARSEARFAGRAQPELRLPTAAELPPYEPAPAGEEPPPQPLDRRPRFMGQPDDEILARICNTPIKSLRPLGGGASISLKLVLEGGQQAALKPEQLRVTRYQSEVAAYRVSRALGLGMVPPSCVRKLSREQLMAGMPKALVERMEQELVVDSKGLVACAVITWVPHLHGLRLEELDWWRPLLLKAAPIPAHKRKRLLDISTLLLFDYLILNHDRWSGGNTHESDGQMVFIDQGAGFGPEHHHRRSRSALHTLRWSERFPREVAESLFELDSEPLAKELSELLSAEEVEEFLYRVRHAREYLRGLRRAAPQDSLLL